MGNAHDMADMAALLDKISDNIADAYSEKAGGTRDEWRQVMKAETWYTAEEAVEAGLADELLPARKQQPEPGEAEPAMRQFDLTAYGYTCPAKAETPKPGPPPAAEAQQVTLTFNLGDTVDEQMVEALRAMVRTKKAEPEPQAVVVPEPTVEPEVPAEPVAAAEPVEPAAPIEPAPADDWAADVAHLTTTPADEWAADLAHLTGPDSSSSAATVPA
jgi:hypothetical protein